MNLVLIKISSSLYTNQKVKNIISTRNLLTIYYSLIYPEIDYGIILWRTTQETYVKKVIVTQKMMMFGV